MKKLTILLVCLAFLAIGCTKEPPPAPKPDNTPSTSHLTAVQDGVTLEVSKELRTFPKTMIATKEGYDVVGLSVIIINKTADNLPISPEYVTLEAIDKTVYKYSEVTDITGKGAFKAVALPPDYRGGGLLLFEIKKDVKINKVIYKDEKGHNLSINLEPDAQAKI